MKILLATDGSVGAGNAADMLVQFPFPTDRSAIVLTVLDRELLDMDKRLVLDEDQHRLLKETEQNLLSESRKLLAATSARLKDAGWICSTELRSGSPAEEIIKAASKLQPDMIVMGSHGHSGVKHFLLGSVSDQVLRHSHCSVLVVRPSPALSAPPADADRSAPWRILVAYDGSESADQAIRLCASLPLGSDTQVSVVGVMPLIHMYRQDVLQHLSTIWQQQKHARKETLENAVGTLHWSTPHVTAELLESTDVSHEILDLVRNRAIDLVVIGSKGRSTLKRFLLGSITSRVTSHASCSALVVRAQTTSDQTGHS
jgi:nucleotide-binding universal stress UspA family protein